MLVALELDMAKIKKELIGKGKGAPKLTKQMWVDAALVDMAVDLVEENKDEWPTVSQLVTPMLRAQIEALWKVRGQKAAKVRKLREQLTDGES